MPPATGSSPAPRVPTLLHTDGARICTLVLILHFIPSSGFPTGHWSGPHPQSSSRRREGGPSLPQKALLGHLCRSLLTASWDISVFQEADSLGSLKCLICLGWGIAVLGPSILFSGLIFLLGEMEQRSSALVASTIAHANTVLSCQLNDIRTDIQSDLYLSLTVPFPMIFSPQNNGNNNNNGTRCTRGAVPC